MVRSTTGGRYAKVAPVSSFSTSSPSPAGRYVGRFAPSPTGPLHAGSLVAALASYLDARANGGIWLIRIEDIDEGRAVPGAAETILEQLDWLGMHSDGEIVWQSRRKDLYQAARERIADHVYGCGCNRREIADSRLGVGPDGAAIYPGTCRHGLAPGREARSLRLRVPEAGEDLVAFRDRFAGWQEQRLALESGDFVLKRADGYWAYQLAVVVDDAAQGITHVVRGEDLVDNTPRQLLLQRALKAPQPSYLHAPLVLGRNGEKLSKQNGAQALDLADPRAAVVQAAGVLGLQPEGSTLADVLAHAVRAWAARWP